MKKTLLLSIAVMLGLMLATPVMAVKPTDKAVGKFVRRMTQVSGELTVINGGTASSTSLTVKIKTVKPKKNKNWVGAYPEVSKDLIVLVDAKTKFVRKYWGKSSLEELTIGDKLNITAKTNEDGTLTARLVKDDTLHWTWKVHNGVIDGLDATAKTFTLKQNNKKSVTVKIDAKTKIYVPPYTATGSTFADLQNGQIAHVRGIINNKTKIITASFIRVGIVKPVVALPMTTITPVATTTSI